MPKVYAVWIFCVTLVACGVTTEVDPVALPPDQTTTTVPTGPFDPAKLGAAIELLSTGDCADRSPGTKGDKASADYVASAFDELHLTVQRQAFIDAKGRATENVIGVLASTGASQDVIVVGAHRDHLPADGLLQFPGANDNASGTAGLVAIARALAAIDTPPRTIAFVSFGSAEEPALEGSRHLVSDTSGAFDLDHVVFMLDLDMIGSYAADEVVYALGASTSKTAYRFLDDRNDAFPLEMDLDSVATFDSDNVPFCEAGVPYTFFFTPDPDCYRETCDTHDRIDTQSMSQIVGLAASLANHVATTTADLAAERRCD